LGHRIDIKPKQGQEEYLERQHPPHHYMVRRFCRLVRNEPDNEVGRATLETSRPQTVIINGASEACAVKQVDEAHIKQHDLGEKGVFTAIEGINELWAKCTEQRKLPSEIGGVDWAQSPGQLDLTGYSHFAGPKGG
jgi:hypothetical protein